MKKQVVLKYLIVLIASLADISRKYFDGSLAYAAIDTEWKEMLSR